MADTFRYRGQSTNPVIAPVVTAQAVSIGDLVGLSSGNVYRASDHSFVGGLSTAQANFVTNFLGISAQRKLNTSAYPGFGGGLANRIRINTAGVFEMDTYASTFALGDWVGPTADSTGSALEPQKVGYVNQAARAVGVVVQKKSDATSTKVLVKLFSKKIDLALT